MGDWNGHLTAMQQMLPLFAAAGHYLYSKSCYAYHQEIFCLNESSPDIY